MRCIFFASLTYFESRSMGERWQVSSGRPLPRCARARTRRRVVAVFGALSTHVSAHNAYACSKLTQNSRAVCCAGSYVAFVGQIMMRSDCPTGSRYCYVQQQSLHF